MSKQIIINCKQCGHEMVLDELLEAQIAEEFTNKKVSILNEREKTLKTREKEFEEKRKRKHAGTVLVCLHTSSTTLRYR